MIILSTLFMTLLVILCHFVSLWQKTTLTLNFFSKQMSKFQLLPLQILLASPSLASIISEPSLEKFSWSLIAAHMEHREAEVSLLWAAAYTEGREALSEKQNFSSTSRWCPCKRYFFEIWMDSSNRTQMKYASKFRLDSIFWLEKSD